MLPTILAAFVGCSTMLMLSVVRWIKRDPAARYYTVAWVFMLFGGIVLALSKFTVLPRNLITENATQVGSALGVILLSVALADRIKPGKETGLRRSAAPAGRGAKSPHGPGRLIARPAGSQHHAGTAGTGAHP